MDYWHEITVPLNTPASAPVTEAMVCCPGTVKEVMLAFPKGQRGTTRCRVLRFGHQVWPTTPGAWYRGDGWIIEFPENFPVVDPPFEFVIEAYNSDTADDHTVMIRMTILRDQPVPTIRPPVPVFEGLL